MARTGRELSIAKGAQLAAQRLLGDRDAELLPNPLDEIDQAPAHDTVDGRDRALVDDTLQSLTLLVVEKRTGTWRPAGHQTLWSVGVEAKHPVPHDLQRDAADPGRLGTGGSIIDRRQSEKAPGLIRITRALGQGPQMIGGEVGSERDRSSHGDLVQAIAL